MGHSDVARSALPYVAAAAVSWYIYKIFIAPFLSPLRKIPGRPYKPVVGNMLEAMGAEAGDNTINWMTEYKSRIVRYYYFHGDCRVLVADPELVRYIMITNSRNYSRGSPSALRRLVPGFVLLLHGEEHHAVRKLINPVFNSKSTNDFIPVFEETARKVLRLWYEAVSKNDGSASEVPAQKHMTMLTLEAVCRCGFDYNINSVEDPDHAGVQSFQRMLATLQIKLSNMLPLQQWLPTKSNRQMWADIKFYRSTILDVITKKRQKMEEGEQSKDLLSRLLRATDDEGRTLDDKNLFGQIGGFLFAGFETTSMNLTWTLLLLAQHPDVQEKARQEALKVLPDPEQPVSVEMLEQLPYLTAIIRESL
ncbi:cytochrome P450, partial [Elysia marginata]